MQKKVAIATFVSNNYGTCLQAFALKQAVQKLGCICDVYTFRGGNKNTTKKKSRLFEAFSLIVKYNPLGFIRFLSARKFWILNDKQFDSFIKTYINPKNGLLLKDDDVNSFTCAITGSDMVWSPEYLDYFDSFFLRWIHKDRRISYAPSFGSTTVNAEVKEIYKSYLQEIKSLSCREKSGCEFITSLTGLEAKLVCDPTLLFDRSEWLSLLPVNANDSNIILVNCFGGLNPVDAKELKKITAKRKLNVHYLNIGVKETLNEACQEYEGYGPIQFLSYSSSSQFQIVNGYHGLLFALIFNKPFVVLHRYGDDHWKTHEKRMSDLLDYIGLSDRYLYSLKDVKEEHFRLDYSKVNNKIQKLREESWNYLDHSLNQFNYD